MSDFPTPDSPPRAGLPIPPRAEIRPTEFVVHGTRIRDDYAWLKAANWKDVLEDGSATPPDILAYLKAENAHTAALMADAEPLRRTLVAEMRARIREDDDSVPEPDGPYAYFARFRDGGEHPLACRQPRGGGPDEILLDGDKEAEGTSYFDIGDTSHSPDHRRLAWSADDAGSELYVIKVRDLSSGEDLADEIAGTTGEVVWRADSAAFYYVELDDNHRPSCVRLHRLGTDPSDDPLIYEETQTGWFVDIDATTSRAFLLISINDHETSEIWLGDLASEIARPICVAARTPLVIYDVDHHGGDLIIRTNDGGAEDFKLVTAPLASPGRDGWRDIVPYRPGIMILTHVALARYLVRLERENANPRIVVRDLESGEEHAVAFDEDAYALGLDPGFEYDTGVIRFIYSSMTRPAETFDYDIASHERRLRKRQEVPSGFDPSAYITRRLYATAADGEAVPISLVHRRDLVIDGSAPCLLYGYGAYGSSMSSAFRTNPLSLIDRGFVYAIAHVRGGTEKGWRWYLDGKRDKKPNTFTDFVACAEALVAARYTGRGRLVAYGGSAGGMLMGALANLAGDLFAGIVADVPFVDVLNTMLDGDLPLTPPEWPEWGNPAADEAAFRTILSYSPYENVRAKPYPAILALGGLTDPRVTYWEPAKWVAKLRATMTGGGPVLLKINTDAGHGGAAGRFERLEELGLVYAFAITTVGGGWPSEGPGP